jgi:hypothetical protein
MARLFRKPRPVAVAEAKHLKRPHLRPLIRLRVCHNKPLGHRSGDGMKADAEQR